MPGDRLSLSIRVRRQIDLTRPSRAPSWARCPASSGRWSAASRASCPVLIPPRQIHLTRTGRHAAARIARAAAGQRLPGDQAAARKRRRRDQRRTRGTQRTGLPSLPFLCHAFSLREPRVPDHPEHVLSSLCGKDDGPDARRHPVKTGFREPTEHPLCTRQVNNTTGTNGTTTGTPPDKSPYDISIQEAPCRITARGRASSHGFLISQWGRTRHPYRPAYQRWRTRHTCGRRCCLRRS